MVFDKLSIRNFRVFNGEANFDFAPITVLTGPNSSGKSSLTKALLLWKSKFANENLQENSSLLHTLEKLDIDENLSIGNFDHWLNNVQNTEDAISFTFPFSFSNVLEDYSMELAYKKDTTQRKAGALAKIRIYETKSLKEVLVLSRERFYIDLKTLWQQRKEQWAICNFLHEMPGYKREQFNLLINDRAESEVETKTAKGEPWIKPVFITLEEYLNILTPEIRSSYLAIRERVRKISPDKYPVLSSHGKIEFDFPLLTYDIIHKPGEGDKINYYADRKDYEFSDADRILFDKLQQVELETLQEYLNTEFSHSNESSQSVIHFFESELTKLFRSKLVVDDSYKLPIGMPPIYKPQFSKLVEKIAGEVSQLGIELTWILDNNRGGEAFGRVYDYHANANGLVNEIISSFGNSIKKISKLFSNIENVPAIRNVLQDRAYALKDKNNYFTSMLLEYLRSPDEEVQFFTSKLLTSVVKILDIADNVEFKQSDDGVIVNVFFYKGGKRINLADLGHGMSQLLPIILRIVLADPYPKGFFEDQGYNPPPKTVIVEEPETNLHPLLQSRLADVFVLLAKKYNLRFIIETHSEYLVRKLQYLTARRVEGLECSDTKIYYFNDPHADQEAGQQIRQISIDEYGMLSGEFGTGFFDESDKIAMSLWSLTHSQSN